MIHVVDHLTQCSACCVIQSKRIAIFGSPKIFLVGNGGEFDNSEFVSFCENFNINIKTTVVESHWSSGLVEFHNGVLGNTVRKMMSDKPNYSLETGVAWAIAAKNSLKNVYGFFPNQLVFIRACWKIETSSSPSNWDKFWGKIYYWGWNVLQDTNRRLLEDASHNNRTRESAGPDRAWVYIPENASV